MSTIKKLREIKGYTQEELASLLHVDRVTLIAYEKDSSKIPAGKVAAIAGIFEVDCDCIINNTEPKTYTYNITDADRLEPAVEQSALRIDVPENKIEKFKEVLLYIVGKIGARPNVGQTVLYKILYFIDFDYYELFEEQLIGARYIKNTFGPTPVDFTKITRKMANEGVLVIVKDKYFERDQTKYLPRREANLDMFSAKELKHIDNCIQKYGSMNARELSAYSHKDAPWIGANDKEPIAYESVFYRGPETSVRSYDDE